MCRQKITNYQLRALHKNSQTQTSPTSKVIMNFEYLLIEQQSNIDKQTFFTVQRFPLSIYCVLKVFKKIVEIRYICLQLLSVEYLFSASQRICKKVYFARSQHIFKSSQFGQRLVTNLQPQAFCTGRLKTFFMVAGKTYLTLDNQILKWKNEILGTAPFTMKSFSSAKLARENVVDSSIKFTCQTIIVNAKSDGAQVVQRKNQWILEACQHRKRFFFLILLEKATGFQVFRRFAGCISQLSSLVQSCHFMNQKGIDLLDWYHSFVGHFCQNGHGIIRDFLLFEFPTVKYKRWQNVLLIAVTWSTTKFAEKMTKSKFLGVKGVYWLTTIIAQPILQFHEFVEVSEIRV